MSGRRLPFGAPIVTAARMRAAEQAAIDGGVSVDELMARAGLAVAQEVRRFAQGRAVLILAGPGNNGGDAWVAARHLAGWGLNVTVAALGTPGEGAAARAAAAWTGATLPLGEAAARPVLVDGLFGTGGARPLDETLFAAVDSLRRQAELVIAIDLPSGVGPDGAGAGRALGADVTIALGVLKPAHVTGAATAACGHVILADIGVPVASDWRSIAPPRLADLHGEVQKFTRGMVTVVGGAMPGASLLAATAAMHGGAGYVVLAGRHDTGVVPHALVRRDGTDAAALAGLLDDERIGCAVIGPGLGRDDAARAILDRAIASPRDLVIDADALSLLGGDAAARLHGRKAPVFLTPHGGEFDRMFGASDAGKIERTLAAAARTGAVILHKGGDTVIAAPDGRVVVLASATPWLSTAGTGDVLAGLLGARHAVGDGDALAQASEAAWLHAAAATLLVPPFVADDLVGRLPAAVAAATWP